MTLTGALLDPLLAGDAMGDRMGPRITYYDDAAGERIELSTVTLANWAAKTANLLRDELGAGPGSRVAVLLPAHWQTAAVLLGVWWIGAEAVLRAGDAAGADIALRAGDAAGADIALCTRDRLDEADTLAPEVAVLSLDPFGRPAEDLPVGVTDYATAVRVHGDQIVPERHPGPALDGRGAEEVLEAAREAARRQGIAAGDRVMSALPWSTPAELTERLLSVLAAGASLVQLADPDPALLERRRAAEKVTRTLE